MAPHGKLSLQWVGDTLPVYVSAQMNSEGAILNGSEIKRGVKLQRPITNGALIKRNVI